MVVRQFPSSELQTRMTSYSPLPSPDVNVSDIEDDGTTGYDFDFVPALDNKYMCPICLNALRDPVQTECGHRFCHQCILRCIRNKARCPVDQTPLSSRQLFHDRSAHREVLDLQVKCKNQDCVVVLELRNIQKHIDTCPFRQFPCKYGCGLSFQTNELAVHEESVCPNRPMLCGNCGRDYPAEKQKEHNDSCTQQQPVDCPHCKHKVKQYKLKQHISEECLQAPIHCVFDKIGCHKMHSRHEIQKHMETSTQLHLQYLLSTVSSLQKRNDALQDNLKEAQSKLDSVQAAEKSLVSDVPSSSNSIDCEFDPSSTLTSNLDLYTPDRTGHEYDDDIARLKAYNRKRMEHGSSESSSSSSSSPGVLHSASNAFDSQFSAHDSVKALENMHKDHDLKIVGLDHHVRELTAKMDNQTTLMKEINGKLSAVEQRMEEAELRCCGGLYYWKIKEYVKLRKAATIGEMPVLHSPGFYTSPQGYRICIRANLDGVDKAQGTHLSLFVHIMKGEFDELLAWPFHGSITLTIINQRELPSQRSHISETLEARSNLMAFHRPVTERNQKGYGYIDFFPLKMIETEGFIKANTLIIKAQVKVYENTTR